MRYFSYGANMFSPRIQGVIPTAKCLNVACLPQYRLFFHKKGLDAQDPSGKCNIVFTRDLHDKVFGVLWEIAPRYRYLLDRAVGLGYGYQEITVKVTCLNPNGSAKQSDQEVFAFAYVAHKESVNEALRPYTWYKNMVIEGAKQHHLPQHYIDDLTQVGATLDPNGQPEQEGQQDLGTAVFL